jgi:hypothetical protein
MALTKASMAGEPADEDRGGSPNPGTKKDKRLTKNKRDAGWAAELAAKSGGLPIKAGPAK